MGKEATQDVRPLCNFCRKTLPQSEAKRCSRCHSGWYCSVKCQRNHWTTHKRLCEAIASLSQCDSKTSAKTVEELKGSVFELSPKTREKLVKLVGDKCVVTVGLEGVSSKVLWDTGAQVSLVEDEWVKSRFPRKQIRVRAMSELFDQEFVVTSASGDSLGVKGAYGGGYEGTSKCTFYFDHH